eukprot:TRINITY_DN4349_c0_g1_i1.p1 TRINITY_DN4349_c0_g1~~TRINITY_DN4349_c0_g1_i1.p1  ORF type:complete len:215 (-),score=56.34 TRINITY_DN4349_c0_g1_i1:175-732(-)
MCIRDRFENMNKSKKSTHEEIERLIKELELEEKKLRHKKEYEQISHTILEYDSIDEFSKKIEKVKKQIEDMTKEHNNQLAKIELKKKQLYVILTALQDFQDLSNNEENPDRIVDEANQQRNENAIQSFEFFACELVGDREGTAVSMRFELSVASLTLLNLSLVQTNPYRIYISVDHISIPPCIFV